MLTLRTVNKIVYKGTPQKPMLDMEAALCEELQNETASREDILKLTGHAAARSSTTQRAQYPSIKEYTLNHNMKAPIILGIFLN